MRGSKKGSHKLFRKETLEIGQLDGPFVERELDQEKGRPQTLLMRNFPIAYLE
jgi:hypothetical protein